MRRVRADHAVSYDATGRGHLVVTSLDAPFVVSAYLEHSQCACWHFAYTRAEQERVAEVVEGDATLRRAILVAWSEAVDPDREGHHPGVELDLILTGARAWARMSTGEREERRPVVLLTRDESVLTPSPVRLGAREIFADVPYVPAERVRAGGAQYVRTGRLPWSVAWQRRTGLVAQGPFGRQLVPEEELPPRLEWNYPKQAQPWAHDPPPLTVD